MVRALIDGRKTQTRRLAWGSPFTLAEPPPLKKPWLGLLVEGGGVYRKPSLWRRVKAGDRLWVRETLQMFNREPPTAQYAATITAVVAPPGHARHIHGAALWTYPRRVMPGIHMPRWASRLTLDVTAAKVEQLQAISEDDAKAEGMLSAVGDGGAPGSGYKWTGTGYHGAGFDAHGGETFHTPTARGVCSCKVGGPSPAQCAYRELWESLHGQASWDANPEVVALTFTVTNTNIDSLARAA